MLLVVSKHPPAISEEGTVAMDFASLAAASAAAESTADLGVAAPEVDDRVGLVGARGDAQLWRWPQAACGELRHFVSANVAHGACGCCMCRRYMSRLAALGSDDDDDDDEFDLARQEASSPHMFAPSLEAVCEAP